MPIAWSLLGVPEQSMRLLGNVSVCILLVSSYRFCTRARHALSSLYKTHRKRRRLQLQQQQQRHTSSSQARQRRQATPQRTLYVVTSMLEFDNGRRETTKGYDRFSNTIVPIVREAVNSMVESGYAVDVYLIAHYTVSETRRLQLASQLPPQDIVGLQVWDEATPMGYALENSKTRIMPITRGLARQHRYVIKDKFFHYDVFVNFEDDMLVRGSHVDHFVNVTDTLFGLRQTAQQQLPFPVSVDKAADLFYGPMTVQQLARTIPGFMRVEAALASFKPSMKNRYEQIPINYQWNDQDVTSSIDPSICCHVAPETTNAHIPLAPDKDSLFFWETSIDALGVRHIPKLDWVLLLGGSNNEVWGNPAYVVGDFWSGRDATYFGTELRPDRKKGRYLSNQGGWMGTRRQLFEWHFSWCRGGFLPPYNLPHYRFDGLDLRPVEYWSGGIQLVGVNSCNLQRVVSVAPQEFSKHLLYHTSNNKQRVRNVKHQFSGRSINQFWGQLNTIKKTAERAMRLEQRRFKN